MHVESELVISILEEFELKLGKYDDDADLGHLHVS